MQVKANRPQGEFLSMNNKYRAFVAGYGSGKTWVGCMAQVKHFWEHPKINQGYFAPTYPQIRDIFYPTIEEVAFNMGLNVEIKTSDKEVSFYSGRNYRGTTICRSMERPQTIIGFKIGHALIDELDVMEQAKAETAWRKIIARMRYNDTGIKNGIDVTTTPEGFRETYKLFVSNLQKNESLKLNYGLVQASTYDNEKNLPADYISSLFEIYPEELISAYIKGEFVNLTSGTVYKSYNRITHRSSETIIDKEPLFIGMDFNVQHMAATIYVQRKNGWHAVSELKDVFDTPDIIKIISENFHLKGHRIIVYPDASGGSRKSVDASKSDIALLENAKFEVRAKPKNPLVKDRVAATNKAFQESRLWINDKLCPTVAENLEKQSYDKNSEPDKKGGFDHQNDATTYPIIYEFPIVKPVINQPINFVV